MTALPDVKTQLQPLLDKFPYLKTQDKVAVFDVHGTLLQPTWKDEFAEVYRSFMGGDHEAGLKWVEANLVGVEREKITDIFVKATGATWAQVKKKRVEAHQRYRDRRQGPSRRLRDRRFRDTLEQGYRDDFFKRRRSLRAHRDQRAQGRRHSRCRHRTQQHHPSLRGTERRTAVLRGRRHLGESVFHRL